MIEFHVFGKPIKTLGSLGKIRVGRVTGNTHIFFGLINSWIALIKTGYNNFENDHYILKCLCMSTLHQLSRVMRKPAICMCINKGAHQPKVKSLYFLNSKSFKILARPWKGGGGGPSIPYPINLKKKNIPYPSKQFGNNHQILENFVSPYSKN